MEINIERMRAAHESRKKLFGTYNLERSQDPDSMVNWWLALDNLAEVQREVAAMIQRDGKVLAIMTVGEMLPRLNLEQTKRFVDWAAQQSAGT